MLDEGYIITTGWDGAPPSDTSDTFPSSFSVTTLFPDLGLPSGFTLVDYNLELSLSVNAICQNLSGSHCLARISSVNSSYIGLTGAYTSQNGYQYLRLNAGDPGGDVPEPATYLLLGPALAGLMIVRRRK